MSSGEWYFTKNGQRGGPTTAQLLQQMAAQGSLSSSDYVWAEGLADWQSVGSIDWLAPYVPGANVPAAGGLDALAAAAVVPDYAGGYHPGHRRPGRSYEGYAIAGFVLSLLIPLLGLIFSWTALSGMKANNNPAGRGFAIAGMVISILSFVLACLVFSLLAATS